jgi:hypothetical protein
MISMSVPNNLMPPVHESNPISGLACNVACYVEFVNKKTPDAWPSRNVFEIEKLMDYVSDMVDGAYTSDLDAFSYCPAMAEAMRKSSYKEVSDTAIPAVTNFLSLIGHRPVKLSDEMTEALMEVYCDLDDFNKGKLSEEKMPRLRDLCVEISREFSGFEMEPIKKY